MARDLGLPRGHRDRVARRTRAIIATSSCQWHGSSNQRRSCRSTSRAKRMASSRPPDWRRRSGRNRRPRPCARRPRAPRQPRGESADLELAARHAGGRYTSISRPMSAEGLALHVVAADRDRQPVAVTAEQRGHGLAEGLAQQVPAPRSPRTRSPPSSAGWSRPCGQREERLPDSFALMRAGRSAPARARPRTSRTISGPCSGCPRCRPR